MSKEKIVKKLQVEPNTSGLANPEAVLYVNYMMDEATQARDYCGQIFQSNVDLYSDSFKQKKESAIFMIKELEISILKIKEFLDSYVPQNKIDKVEN